MIRYKTEIYLPPLAVIISMFNSTATIIFFAFIFEIISDEKQYH